MTWSRNPNEVADSPPVFYHSEATTEKQARADFRTVFDEFVSHREKHGAPSDAQVLFQVNSVNSFVDVSWTDKSFETVGQWTYTIWLLPLGEACLEHEDGTDHFVWLAKSSIYDMVYDYYWDQYGDEFETQVCYPLCYFWVPEYTDKPDYIIM